MALAILQLLAFQQPAAKFNIDIGTNKFYQLRIGKGVERKGGIDWIDNVSFSTAVNARNGNDSGLLSLSNEIAIPIARFDNGNGYIQLLSVKTPAGKSPAFSEVVRLPVGVTTINPIRRGGFGRSFSELDAMNGIGTFRQPRTVPCATYGETYSKAASLEDLLSGIIKFAAPTVMKTLSGTQGAPGKNGGAGPATSNDGTDGAGIVSLILKTLLGSLSGTGSTLSGMQSLSANERSNRFSRTGADGYGNNLSHPFIFGIDDAVIGTLIGPLVQILPQLMNEANQKRVQLKQADNKIVTDILSEVNRRMLLEQLGQARSTLSPGQAPDQASIDALIKLLTQASSGQGSDPAAGSPALTAPTSPALVPVKPSIGKSLSLTGSEAAPTPSKAILSFVMAEALPWNGSTKLLFSRGAPIQLNLRLVIGDPIPKAPLPKAIVKFFFKDVSDHSLFLEKTFKEKDLAANSTRAFAFSLDDLSHLPANRDIAVVVQLRWRSAATGVEHAALGSSNIVVVNKYFVKDQAKEVGPERELTDMKKYRPFWNKIWEAPLLDGTAGDNMKYLWELDANVKYSVLLSPTQESNGLMQTKLLRGPIDQESLTDRTEGRMKAGIELSIAELNKLLPLWDGESALNAEKLEAVKSESIARTNAGELVYNVKLKGKAAERGLVWVIPVFKLFEFTLNLLSKTNESGQVVAVTEQKARLPLPVSARIIGLRSQQ